VGRNANLLLNFPVDRSGRIAPADSARIMEWRRALDAEFAHDLLSYRRIFRTNRWHDAPDVLTGIAEREICGTLSKKIRALSFKR